MAKAQLVAYAEPGHAGTAASRHVLRLLVLAGLLAGAWLIGVLALTATAHADTSPDNTAPPAATEPAKKTQPEPDSPAESDQPAPEQPAVPETAPAPTGDEAAPDDLLGGVIGAVTDTVRKPIERIVEPIRQVVEPVTKPIADLTEPIRGEGPVSQLPVISDLLPDRPEPQPDTPPIRTLPAPAGQPLPEDSALDPLPQQQVPDSPARAGAPAEQHERATGHGGLTAARPAPLLLGIRPAGSSVLPMVSPFAATQQALDAAPFAPLHDPAQGTDHDPAPAPAPPAPAAKINQAQPGSGNDREQFAVLFGTAGQSLNAGATGEHGERAHRGAAAPGLPATSPD